MTATLPTQAPTLSQRRFRLSRKARTVVLTVHVLAAVGWFGIAATVAFFGYAAAITNDDALADALHLAMRSAIPLSIPAGLLAAIAGSVLSLGTGWGFVRYRWVILKEIITAAVIVTDPLVLLPAIRDTLDGGAATEPFGPMTAHVVMLTVATVLSIVKPFGRRRRARPST